MSLDIINLNLKIVFHLNSQKIFSPKTVLLDGNQDVPLQTYENNVHSHERLFKIYIMSRLCWVTLILISAQTIASQHDTMTWDELDSLPLPSWYGDAKFGIFIHWGLFSVPGYLSPWFQSYWQGHWSSPYGNYSDYENFVNRTERKNFAYADYAHRFTAELYNPDYWAEMFSKSGAQYVVLTSKHHEGYCMWNSTDVATTWNWNVMDVGPRSDLLGRLARAIKNTSSASTGKQLKFGIYHSLLEFFNPLYRNDQKNNYTTQMFVDAKALPELHDLVNKYKPDLLWSDGAWESDSVYWKATQFLTWYHRQNDDAVWNDRWGTDATCQHGSYLTCQDQYEPGTLSNRKWEKAMVMDTSSWGFNRNATAGDFLSVKQLVHTLIQVVSKNGNLLLNVAPAGDGTIHPLYMDRLMGIGQWLQVNGEAIYSSSPWSVCQNETSQSIYYTTKNDTIYAILTEWPETNYLKFECLTPSIHTRIRFLGLDPSLTIQWKKMEQGKGNKNQLVVVHLPLLTPNLIPCQHAWTLAIDGII